MRRVLPSSVGPKPAHVRCFQFRKPHVHAAQPPLPVEVIGKGNGYAIAVIDYGQEHKLIWVAATAHACGLPAKQRRS